MIPLNRPPRRFTIPADERPENTWIKQRLKEQHSLYYTLSAREGLHVIYATLYSKKGKLKIGVSPLTCFEALYPILQNGHEIVFIDIDRKTFNLDESKLFGAEIDGVQLIHLGGNPQRLNKVREWSLSTKGIVIEDCAQALGASYNNILAGTTGSYAVFSMVKNVFTPYGGLILSENELQIKGDKVGKKLTVYKSVKRILESQCTAGGVNILNTLYRLLLTIRGTDGAEKKTVIHELDSDQVKKMDSCLTRVTDLNEKRRSSYTYLTSMLDNERLFLQEVPEDGKSSYNRALLLSPERNAKEIIVKLRRKGIAANNLTQSYMNPFQPPVYDVSEFSEQARKADLRVYKEIHDRLLAIPFSPFLSKSELRYIADSVNDIAAA